MKENPTRRQWLMIAVIAILVFAWSALFWPGIWVYSKQGAGMMRVNRLTGEVQRIYGGSGGWRR